MKENWIDLCLLSTSDMACTVRWFLGIGCACSSKSTKTDWKKSFDSFGRRSNTNFDVWSQHDLFLRIFILYLTAWCLTTWSPYSVVDFVKTSQLTIKKNSKYWQHASEQFSVFRWQIVNACNDSVFQSFLDDKVLCSVDKALF